MKAMEKPTNVEQVGPLCLALTSLSPMLTDGQALDLTKRVLAVTPTVTTAESLRLLQDALAALIMELNELQASHDQRIVTAAQSKRSGGLGAQGRPWATRQRLRLG